MTAKAVIREADVRRLVKVAKSENVAIRVGGGEWEITIFPDIHAVTKQTQVDETEDIRL